MVIVQTVDDGLVDVIEGPAGTEDMYTIRLSQKPTTNVIVKVDAVKTRSTYGRTALFQEQVTVGSGNASEMTLTFSATTWATPQNVIVRAIDDTVFDGN